MQDKYWTPNQIRFTEEQIIWLISFLPLLRNGEYLRNPKESGYLDTPIGKRALKAEAGFERAAAIAAELDSRLQQVGWEGLILEMVYSGEREDREFIMNHIAEALNTDINEIEWRVARALGYITGSRRKGRLFREWANHRKGG